VPDLAAVDPDGFARNLALLTELEQLMA